MKNCFTGGVTIKAIFIVLTLAGFASGAEMEVTDRLSVDGSSIFKSTAVFSGNVGIGTSNPASTLQVISSSDSAYVFIASTGSDSGSYVLKISTGGRVYKGAYEMLDSSMLDDFSLKIDTATGKIKLADRMEENIVHSAFQMAVISSMTKFNMVDGILDGFEDQSGVDTGGSSNQSYDTANHFYQPTSGMTLDKMEYTSDVNVQAAYVTNAGTNLAQTASAMVAISANQPDLGTMRDGSISGWSGYWRRGVYGPGGKIGYEWASPVTINKIRYYQFAQNGMLNHIYIVRYDNGNWTKVICTGWEDGASNDGSGGANVTTSNGWKTVTFPPVSDTKFAITEDGTTPYINDYDCSLTELEMHTPNAALQAYSEAAITHEGSYALKGTAVMTDSLNKTLTRTIGSPLDLSNNSTITFWTRSSRTGANLQLQLHDTGGTTSVKDINITSADTWQQVTWDITGINNPDKDAIDKIIIKVTDAGAGNTFYMDDIITPPGNMTLKAGGASAEAVPSNARIVLFEEDVDSITLNTDLKAYVSRYDTATWAQATLADEGDYQGGRRILAGNADLSSQTSGTTMRWQITTHNRRNLKLYGVGLTWD